MPSDLERVLVAQLRYAGVPDPTPELAFHPARKWCFDLAWPDRRLAVEIEGGVHTRGRHTRGAGFTADCEKYNAAVLLGWRVLRFTGKQVHSGEALKVIESAVAGDLDF